MGEDGRLYDEKAYVSEEVPSYEDTVAMCFKMHLYIRMQHSDDQVANMVLSVEQCLRKEMILSIKRRYFDKLVIKIETKMAHDK